MINLKTMSTYTCLKNLQISFTIRRCYASQKKPKLKKYTSTVRLPSTEFPLWVSGENRVEADAKIEKESNFQELYAWQRNNVHGSEYVLHDGPPYANGPPHMGHAINKILKDIIIRKKLVDGSKIHYVPGWDCHGLPIELKAVSGENESGVSAIDIRRKAKEYAASVIEQQKKTFKTWGILADWDQQCYYTYSNDYVQNQLRQFFNLYEKGYIYRDLKPIYWSPSSKTALAEAELEYEKNHISKAIIVKIMLRRQTGLFEKLYPYLQNNVFALIWTTTPWTLPANKAIAYSENLQYSLIKIDDTNDIYLMATNLIPSLEKLLQKTAIVLDNFDGEDLSTFSYTHPLKKEQVCPLVPGGHVTSSKGTGLVHIAPAHGQDDFVIGLKHNLLLTCIVDENGCYTEEAGEEFKGMNVLDVGTDYIIESLAEDILHTENYRHSYPYDWRTKKPVLLLTSKQWFIATEKLKTSAFNCLENVNILPKKSSVRLVTLLESRPFWCISRQRTWGVPIPVLYDSGTGNPILTRDLIEHYCTLIDKHGTDFWWNLSTKELLAGRPEFSNHENIRKGEDILDIWFDSGISWSSVLGNEKVADLYVEGIDQCTGWFQSSLLTSVGIRNIAPYKNIFIHGFAVDENGHKMSKSVGNVIDPQDIIAGKERQPACGIDVLRWWVAAHAVQTSHIPVTEATIKDSKDSVQKLRHITKFLLGNLHGYVADDSTKNYWILDKYILHRLYLFSKEVDEFYDNMMYHKVCAVTLAFITDLSGIYLHSTKDRLYCDAVNSQPRLACQNICNYALDTILYAVAPIVPHFAEETYLYHPLYKNKTTFFKKKTLNLPESWKNDECANIIQTIFKIKEEVQRSVSKDTKLSQLCVHIEASKSEAEGLQKISKEELLEILQTSSVSVHENPNVSDFKVETTKSSNTICERCRKYVCGESEELCLRCADVVNEAKAVSASTL